jgi:signal transduction histidine kinase
MADVYDMDPRRSLVAGIIWLMVTLAASFAIAASLWAGGVARDIVVQQHMRRLALETDQLASDLTQAIGMRLAAVRALDAPDPGDVFGRLQAAYPRLDWIAMADAAGNIVAVSNDPKVGGTLQRGDDAAASAWFTQGLKQPWVGLIIAARGHNDVASLGDLSAPVKDAAGHVIGVIAAHLSLYRAPSAVRRLSEMLDARGSAQTLLVNRAGTVIAGPDALLEAPWPGTPLTESPAPESPAEELGGARFERLPDHRTVLVVRAPLAIDGETAPQGWQVQLSEPKEFVFQRANALAQRILWISVCLGAVTAALGAFAARHLTNRLKGLTRSAAAVGRNEAARIEVPSGHDEVAQLAGVFAKILDDLHRERGELLKLSSELERRIAVRTREVERLADEARYAAIARERLQIARDLHDTLAHSMMAMLSEVRMLRKLQLHDPKSLPEELARAELVAHAGLNEARTAIAQMRGSTVRDTGLGPALSKAIERFKDHTGLDVTFDSDPEAARFGDERAEIIFRMSEEALRNIERHARASHVKISLRSPDPAHVELKIEDDGVGFDPAVAQPGHFGLVGLQEQAKLIGADLQIASAPGRGAALRLRLRSAPEAL